MVHSKEEAIWHMQAVHASEKSNMEAHFLHQINHILAEKRAQAEELAALKVRAAMPSSPPRPIAGLHASTYMPAAHLPNPRQQCMPPLLAFPSIPMLQASTSHAQLLGWSTMAAGDGRQHAAGIHRHRSAATALAFPCGPPPFRI